MAALDQRLAQFMKDNNPIVDRFLKDMAQQYDKPRLEGAPGSDNNTEKQLEMPSVKRGRPKRATEKIGKTFTYNAKRGETGLRLLKLYEAMKQMGWIAANTQQSDFFDLFSGEESYVRIVWTDDVNVLAEFFREVVSRKKYVLLPDGYSIWVMVNAHFWDKANKKEFGNDRLRCTTAPVEKKKAIYWMARLLDPYQDLDELSRLLSEK